MPTTSIVFLFNGQANSFEEHVNNIYDISIKFDFYEFISTFRYRTNLEVKISDAFVVQRLDVILFSSNHSIPIINSY